MEKRHEIIHFSKEMPIKIFIHKLGSVQRHWHQNIEILFVLSGELNIIVDDRKYLLTNDDLILINKNSIHEIYSEGCELVAFQLNLNSIDLFRDYSDYYFFCCSIHDTHNEKYNYIRYILANLIKENEKGENKLSSFSLTARLLQLLVSSFQAEPKSQIINTQKNLQLLTSITDYVQAHYREGLTLNDIADTLNFSVSYLSRFFKKYMGTTFSDYYNSLRLEQAVNEMLTTDNTLTNIAIEHGFSDVRSFVSLFKKQYGVLPSTYRGQNKSSLTRSEAGEINYLAVTNSTSLNSLAQYLHLDAPLILSAPSIPVETTVQLDAIDTHRYKKYLKHNFRKLCCVGSTRDLLIGEIQDMLRQLQREMNFEFVKFHGLFSDDMMIYDETKDGKPLLSFTLIDKVLDFLLSIGLKPLMQLSFMPKALASSQEKTTFFMQYNTSPPKDMDKWVFLVTSLVRHCIDRYSLIEVLSWPFCVWNEPDTTPEMFGFEDRDMFYQFYRITYGAVKNINPNFQFGSPSLLLLEKDSLHWYHPFFDYCYQNGCLPDFINIHYYDDNLELLPHDRHDGKLLNRLNTDENAFSKYLDHIYRDAEQYHIKDLPVYLTEWNLTVNHRNLINDTCFKACYIAKNLLENYDRLGSFGYWSLTDFISELQPSENLFHGGFGLFTYNGIPKAHYHVFKFFRRLGDQLLASGNGWFVTKSTSSGQIQIILYNYTHYTDLFATGELFDMTLTDRYTPFTHARSMAVDIPLTNMNLSSYLIKESFVNRSHGSVFDSWLKMGAFQFISTEELEILKSSSLPGLYIHLEETKDNTLNLQVHLEPLEVRLIEIIPKA